MGLFDLFKKKGKVQYDTLYSDLFLKRMGKVQNFTDRGDTYLREGHQENPVVYAINSIVAKNGSAAKWVCKNSQGTIIENNPLKMLMSLPMPDKSWSDLIQEMLIQKMITGNTFLAMSRYSEDGMESLSGLPRALFVLPSNEMQIYLTDDGGGIEKFLLDFYSKSDDDVSIDATDVLHIKNPNPDYTVEVDFLFGQSPFRAARRSIQTYNDSLETGVWYLQNRGAQKILFNDQDEMELSPEATDQLKQKIRSQAQSPRNAGNIPIVDAKLNVLDVSSTPNDVLMLEQRIQAAKEICNCVNFPIQLIGIESSTYQNAAEAKKALWQNVIIPELNDIRDGLNRWLAPRFGNNIYLDYDLSEISALQEDKLMQAKARREAYAGMATIDEVRAMNNMPPMGGEIGGSMFEHFSQSGAGEDKPKKEDKQ